MKAEPIAADEPRDLELASACPLCDGDLVLRLGPEGVRSICRRCGAWSRPSFHRTGDGFQLRHPTVGQA
jgi:hypothetical protein